MGYVGILGHHLTDPYWGNQLPYPGATAPYANIVGQSGVIKITQTESASNYNALQAIYRQHLTAGLELTANYTYSKSLTDDIGFYGTSNIGSAEIQKLATKNAEPWEVEAAVQSLLKDHFRPEFLNRIDETILFHSLTREQIAKIVEVQIDHLRKRLADRHLKLSLTPAAAK